MVLEICVDSVESAITAEAGGAERIELCSDLDEGGITPSAGLMHAVRKHVAIEMFAMVRPRGGDFLYTDYEYEAMKYDIAQAKALGADGVVLGMLDKDGYVDVERTRRLVELARPMQVTFHRAFDVSADLEESLARVIATGAHRILTSGAASSAMQGAERIRELIRAARGKIGIMAGGGIRQKNIRKIALGTGAVEFHCSLRNKTDSPMTFRNPNVRLGASTADEYARFVVLEESVREVRRALDKIAAEAMQPVLE